MKNILKHFLFIAAVTFAVQAFAQKPQPVQIPLMRQIFHENIDRTQQAILNSDGLSDSMFVVSNDTALNMQLTYAATNKIDALQNSIELDSTLNNNNKIKFLRGLNEALTIFVDEYRVRAIKPILLPDLVNAFSEGISFEKNNQSIAFLIQKNDVDVDKILVRTIAYSSNIDIDSYKGIIVYKDCKRHPDKALEILSAHANLPFADSIIISTAYHYTETFYDYAASPSIIGNKIRSINDPLVKAISFMASTRSGRQYFPFLDDIYKGTLSYQQVDNVMNDSLKYYNLLVQTEINYANRVRQRDTPMNMKSLDYKLKSTGSIFVNIINGLHESPDDVRFKVIKPLSPEELYYLAVTHEEEMYTSSFVKGVYPLIFKKMKNPRSDSLMMNVKFDRFKKWIKMAANYNELDDFLKRMDDMNAQLLMKAFVNRLDKTQDLEDAVDVADSYGSISNPKIQQLILSQVEQNLSAAKTAGNDRAANIYSILNTLFLSMNDSNHIDVSKELGIQPVYFMQNAAMKDSTGKIIIQQFFYSDPDGKNGYRDFVASFQNSNWKISDAKEWIAVSSTRGTSVTIYANKPLGTETDNKDDDAQSDLCDYLDNNNLEPTMVIHRGHSYHLVSTLKRLANSAKVVLLGSCGGYQSLNEVLNKCPEAQIIASKQTGTTSVNQPMINTMMETLRQGKDLNWQLMWKNFSNQFKGNPLFEDYIPPYKNLGAVFIIAYGKLEDKESDN